MNLRPVAWLVAAAAAIYFSGVDPLERIAAFRADSQALLSGEYQARIAEKYRAEAKTQPLAVVPGDDGMQHELAAARKQMLDDRAAALEKHGSAVLSGDLDALKRQVAENARNAGGQD